MMKITIFWPGQYLLYLRQIRRFCAELQICNGALLAQGPLFSTQKGTFLPKVFQKVHFLKRCQKSDRGVQSTSQPKQCPKKHPPPGKSSLTCFFLLCSLNISRLSFFYPVIVKTCLISFCSLCCIW